MVPLYLLGTILKEFIQTHIQTHSNVCIGSMSGLHTLAAYVCMCVNLVRRKRRVHTVPTPPITMIATMKVVWRHCL